MRKTVSPFSVVICLCFLWTNFISAQNPTQCEFLQGTGEVVSATSDTISDGNPPPPPYSTGYSVFTPAFGSIVEVTTPMNITICFWGDMNGSDETFNVRISNEVKNSGAFGFTTSVGNPSCVTFSVAASSVETDLGDGDIDISYETFGAGWTENPATGGLDTFNAQVQSVAFEYQVNPTITSPADACQDGSDITFTATPAPGTQSNDMGSFAIFPSTPGFTDNNDGTATIDVSAANAGIYKVEYLYEVNGCTYEVSDSIEVFRPPNPKLREVFVDCVSEGDSLSLYVLFDGANDGGTFSSIPAAGIVNDKLPVPAGGGCFEIIYTLDNPDGCSNAPYADTAFMLVTIGPDPSFTISGATSPVCMDGGAVAVTITHTSGGPNPELTINGNTTSFGTNNLDSPTSTGAISYQICVTETIDMPADCGASPQPDYEPCSETVCQTFTIYNDGVGCGANAPFDSECPPDVNATDACAISTRPAFTTPFGCEVGNTIGGIGNIFLNPASAITLIPNYIVSAINYDLLEAEVTPASDIVFCTNDSIYFDWQGSFNGGFGDIIIGGPVIRDLLPPVSTVACTVIEFEICIPLPIVDDVCFDPLPLGELEDICSQTIGQFFADLIGLALGGDGGGGIVVADTDGDGNFDLVVDQYFFPAAGDSVSIPNNITTRNGTITIRNVTGYPSNPTGVCGDVNADVSSLLDRVPLGLIPYVGGAIEGILGFLDCDLDLSFSDEKTVEIEVINNQPPVFANCNEDGYVFTEDLVCDKEVNWSIPVAYDGCNGEILGYRGRTAGTDATNFNGVPPTIVSVDESGLYQIAGPIPGSDLTPGTYAVSYAAYSCGGIGDTCTFPVVVTSGDPILACLNELIVTTDVDQCETIITGLTPRQGIGCATIINFAIDYPDGSGFIDAFSNTPYSIANLGTHNDASGMSFPQGTSTISYTMMVDINGDGDLDDAGETQTCMFDVIVTDGQKPTAECLDIDVQLDNTGNVTVFAMNQLDGSPYIDAGSFDNCDPNPTIEAAKPTGDFGEFVTFDCSETGYNFINLRVTDADGNMSNCLAQINVIDFFDGFEMAMDAPELCLEANNPVQLDFSNYMTITLPNGQLLGHASVGNNSFLGDAVGAFGITAFAPHPGSASLDPGTITQDGIYTPGTGSGFVTISYVLALPGASIPQNGDLALAGCFIIVHETFELRQPLDMGVPQCSCGDEEERVVDLGIVSGGLEPYTIQYVGATLDLDGDGFPDDMDGEYTYDFSEGYDIDDFMQDLGELRVEFTQPVWSLTLIDARGCEIFRSGSCDSDDLLAGPAITCPENVQDSTTEFYFCQRHYEWQHPLPTDNCAVTIYTYQILNPDGSIEGPFDLSALLNIAPGAPLTELFEAEYEFELGISTVSYYAEDAVGNFITCSFEITVQDDDEPYFVNCPFPDIIENAEVDHCDAYINFTLPFADDNCALPPTVTQIDNTGLTSGDRFPVGLTLLYFEAVDEVGNRDTCSVKVIVNDYWKPPTIECPEDLTVGTDLGECSAVVNDIPPIFEGVCQDNLSVVYSTFSDAALTNRLACGVWDASGERFPQGESWVQYMVRSQPLLLITEINQSGGTDQIEITNFGPADLDITWLAIERTSMNPLANEVIGPITMLPMSLDPTILPAGGIVVYDFAYDADVVLPACYSISFLTNVFDQVAVNGFAGCAPFTGALESGDVLRVCEDDTDDATDWAEAANCDPMSIGTLNEGLDVMPANGTMTSFQSIPPNTATCTFKVTVDDIELPFCAEDGALMSFTGTGFSGDITVCNESTITIPPENDCIVGNIDLSINGTWTSPPDLFVTLTNPGGEVLTIMDGFCPVLIGELITLNITFDDSSDIEADALCGMTTWSGTSQSPGDPLIDFFGSKAAGDWTLNVEVMSQDARVDISSWSLDLTCLDPFDMSNVTLENDPGECGAVYGWVHPWFMDNCGEGTISVEYTTADADCVPTGGLLTGLGGYYETAFFCVGTTTVTYTLVDASGNINTCGFDVTVLDVEPPVVVCPLDIIINLGPGECETIVNYVPASTADNCAVVDTVYNPPSGSVFPIGIHEVTIIIFDAAGNSDTCTFNVEVIEFNSGNNTFSCNDLINLSLGPDCMAEITADMILEGDQYSCYDFYCIEILDRDGNIISDNILTLQHVGDTLQVSVSDCMGSTNECWGLIHVEDKLVPEIECPEDITIHCYEEPNPLVTGQVELLSCEGEVVYSFEDEVIDIGQCDVPRAMINRVWTVTDEAGNKSTCEQYIEVQSFDVTDVDFPDDIGFDAAFECHMVNQNPSLTEPSNTGIPMMGGQSIYADNYCQLNVHYFDETLPDAHCASSYVILRHWSVFNSCLPSGADNPRRHAQVIHVRDQRTPSITPFVEVTGFATNQACEAFVEISAVLTDLCSEIVESKWAIYLEELPFVQIIAEGNLPTSDKISLTINQTYKIVMTVKDDCDNETSVTEFITIDDEILPIASCDEHTIVSLSTDGLNGLTLVEASVFDDGSIDNCGPVTFTARRMDSCIDFDWTTAGAGIDDIPDGLVNEIDRGMVHRPSVPFSCCDVDSGPIMVELGVSDVSGNMNFCMVEVQVQDKLSPYLECPPNIFVSCDFWFDAEETAGFVSLSEDPLTPIFGDVLGAFDFDESDRAPITIIDSGNDLFAQPHQWGKDGWTDDNCDVDVKVKVNIYDDCSGSEIPSATLADVQALCAQLGLGQDDCNDLWMMLNTNRVKLIERAFIAEDHQGNSMSCKQKIWVIDFDPFFITDETCQNANTKDGVIWPCDIELHNCPSGQLTPEDLESAPIIFDDNCSLIATTYSDVRFDFVDGACFKILRTWKVIDWCHFDLNTGEGIWEYTQVIKVLDDGAATFINCPEEPITFCAEDPNVSIPNNNQVFLGEQDPASSHCSAHISMERIIVETCSDQIRYDVKVYPFNGIDYIQVMPLTSISVESDSAILRFDTRTSQVADLRQFGLPYNSRYCDDLSYHRVLWSVEDGCGNMSTCQYLFRLEDCKQPSPVCLNGISTVVMPIGGTVTIWAKEFDISSIDDCTQSEDLIFSFSGDNYQPSKEYHCDNVPAFGAELIEEIWVIDEGNDHNCNGQIEWSERNKDYCTTTIVITDNENICGTGGAIAGELMTHDGQSPVEMATVLLTHPDHIFPSITTVENGKFQFMNLPFNGPFTVEPNRNDDHKNGVSTLDLVQMQKHLLGLEQFTSPYQYIAADANNSQNVSALDLVEIRKLILGIFSEFPNNESWRFVDEAFEFDDVKDPWPFNETIIVDALTDNLVEENFMAIKVGDLNNTVVANAVDEKAVVTRKNPPVWTLEMNDEMVKRGTLIEVPVYYKGKERMVGYQFTMNLQGLVYKGIEKGTINVGDENIGVHQNGHLITTSWHESATTGQLIASDEPLFTLRFEVDRSGQLSSLIRVSSDITQAEAYDIQEIIYAIDLDMIHLDDFANAEFELYQNEPNPWIRATKIGFNMPEAMLASLTVYDINGKIIFVKEIEASEGLNEIFLEDRDFHVSSVMYYQLVAGDYTASKKMVNIR
jgi:hypothetical protein